MRRAGAAAPLVLATVDGAPFVAKPRSVEVRGERRLEATEAGQKRSQRGPSALVATAYEIEMRPDIGWSAAHDLDDPTRDVAPCITGAGPCWTSIRSTSARS